MSVLSPIFKKVTLVLLALQILNLSIYNTDFYRFNDYFTAKSQVKEINPIDSFAELVVEDMAGIQNAFPEPIHKNIPLSGDLKHNITFKFYHLDRFEKAPEQTAPIMVNNTVIRSGYKEHYSFLWFKEINHPPA